MWFLPDVTKKPIKPFSAYDIFNELYRPMKIPVDKLSYIEKISYIYWPGRLHITPFDIITNLGV
jgi:hypothetical protein